MKNVLSLFAAAAILATDAAIVLAQGGAPLNDPEKIVVRVTEGGLEPSTIRLHKDDSSVFFLNSTKDSLMSVSVNFGNHRTHCASENLKLGDDGKLQSVQPIGPKDFALTCFPQKGSYQVAISGIAGHSQPLVGTVIVE